MIKVMRGLVFNRFNRTSDLAADKVILRCFVKWRCAIAGESPLPR